MEISGQLHAPATLSSEKEPRYALEQMLGGAQSQSQPLSGIELRMRRNICTIMIFGTRQCAVMSTTCMNVLEMKQKLLRQGLFARAVPQPKAVNRLR
jgi:hypothetical protein